MAGRSSGWVFYWAPLEEVHTHEAPGCGESCSCFPRWGMDVSHTDSWTPRLHTPHPRPIKELKKWGLSPITSSVHILKITLITHALGNCTERFKVKSTLSSLLLDVILGAGRGAKVVWPVASWEGGRATPRLMDTAENEKNLGLRVWRLLRGLNLESR